MKKYLKATSAAATVLALALAAPASANYVDGVTWDPGVTTGSNPDFTANTTSTLLGFVATGAISSAANASFSSGFLPLTNDNIGGVSNLYNNGASGITPAEVVSISIINNINGSSPAGNLWDGRQLTMVMGGFKVYSTAERPAGQSNNLSVGWINIYSDSNVLSRYVGDGTLGDMNKATDGNLWLSLRGVSDSGNSEPSLSYDAAGFTMSLFNARFTVNGIGLAAGLAGEYFPSTGRFGFNSVPEAVDASGSSIGTGTFGPSPTSDCTTGGNAPTCRFASSTAILRADSIEIPEPGSLALLGIGLLGVASIRRRKAA